MPEGTLFPALDGDDPGEVELPDVMGEDRRPTETDWTLPESRTQINSGATGRQLLDIPGADPSAIEQPDPTPAVPIVEGQDAPTQSTRSKRSAEERINQLTARWRREEARASESDQRIAYLTTVIEKQTQALQALQHRPSGSVEASTPADPLLEAATPPLQRGTGHTQVDIEGAIQRALEPIVQRVDAQSKTSQLRTLHELSFARAVEEYPELAQGNSAARQAFNAMYGTHPLTNLEDGPEQIALLVRGVMASTRSDAQRTANQKRAASVQTPQPSATDHAPAGQSRAVQSTYDRAAAERKAGNTSFDTYKALRLAARARQNQR